MLWCLTAVGLIEAADVVLCCDALTGRTLWVRRFVGKGNNYQTRKDAAVNQRTMCAADGRVYALGTSCRLYCLDAASGELLWETATADHQRYRQDKLHSLATRRRTEYLNPGHGFGYESLLAIDGRIIVKIHGGGLQAFAAATGRLAWTQPEAGVSQTCPVPAVWSHEGQTFLLGATRGSVTCTDARTGEIAWRKAGLHDGLSEQVCLPHNRMTDEMRQRGVTAVMSVIRAGHATERTLHECHGMAPFISQEDMAYVGAIQNN